MGKVLGIFIIGLSVSMLLAVNGFNSQLLHGLIGAFMAFLTIPIIFDQEKK
jgi:hypothetical protein